MARRACFALVALAMAPAARAEDLAPACVHPYYPAGDGAVWTYRETTRNQMLPPPGSGAPELPPSEDSYTRRVTRPPRAGPEFDEISETDGAFSVKSTFAWTCTSDGLRGPSLGKSFPMAAIDAAALDSDEDSGVDLPPVAGWKPGATWTRTSEQRAKPGAAVLRTRHEARYTLVGRESVTVPAGSFDAYRIDLAARFETEDAKGTSVPFAVQASHWYAEGVGVVRSRYRNDILMVGDAGEAKVINEGTTELETFTSLAATPRNPGP